MDQKVGRARGVYGITAGYVFHLKEIAVSTIAKLRSRTIADVQANPVAEDVCIEVVPNDLANGHIEKTWNSLIDGCERPSHREAHGQRVRVAEPFQVGGYQLRFPGDGALGAPLSERENCRCFVTNEFVYNDGTRRLIYVGPSAPPRTDGLRPTSLVTLNGTTRARVVLGDSKTLATLRQPTPSTIEVLVNRRVVGRATIETGQVTDITVDPAFAGQDIEGLIRRSVEHSAVRARRA
jgi:hypothetical protein